MLVALFMTPNPVTVEAHEELGVALRKMAEAGIRHLPVVEGTKLVGIVSDRDLLTVTGGVIGARPVVGNNKVRDYLRTELVTAEPEDSVISVLVEIAVRGIGSVPITKDGELVGIVTEMDLLREFVRVANEGLLEGQLDPAVRECMTHPVQTVRPWESLDSVLDLFLNNQVRHVPVVEAGLLMGVISDRDLRRSLAFGFDAKAAAEEIMTPTPMITEPWTSVSQAAAQLLEAKIGCLPVMDDKRLVGILTIPDVLDHASSTLRSAQGAD